MRFIGVICAAAAALGLIDTFQAMDEPNAHVMMGTALSLYPIEQVCAELLAPSQKTHPCTSPMEILPDYQP